MYGGGAPAAQGGVQPSVDALGQLAALVSAAQAQAGGHGTMDAVQQMVAQMVAGQAQQQHQQQDIYMAQMAAAAQALQLQQMAQQMAAMQMLGAGGVAGGGGGGYQQDPYAAAALAAAAAVSAGTPNMGMGHVGYHAPQPEMQMGGGRGGGQQSHMPQRAHSQSPEYTGQGMGGRDPHAMEHLPHQLGGMFPGHSSGTGGRTPVNGEWAPKGHGGVPMARPSATLATARTAPFAVPLGTAGSAPHSMRGAQSISAPHPIPVPLVTRGSLTTALNSPTGASVVSGNEELHTRGTTATGSMPSSSHDGGDGEDQEGLELQGGFNREEAAICALGYN